MLEQQKARPSHLRGRTGVFIQIAEVFPLHAPTELASFDQGLNHSVVLTTLVGGVDESPIVIRLRLAGAALPTVRADSRQKHARAPANDAVQGNTGTGRKTSATKAPGWVPVRHCPVAVAAGLQTDAPRPGRQRQR